MPSKTSILDPANRYEAKVSSRGELVVGTLSYSAPYYVNLAVANTAYEVVLGKAGKQFVITGIVLATDKDFASSTVGERINIYGAHPSDIDTSLDTIFSLELLRNKVFSETSLNLITAKACSIVAIAPADATVDVTIAGYYVDA